MDCPKCQYENREGARFCKEWGLSYTYFCQGYGKKCSRLGKKLLDYGNKHSNIRCLVVGHICVGLGNNSTGDFPAAVKSLEQGVATAVDPFYSQWAKLFLGANYLSNGQLSEAEAVLAEVRAFNTNFGSEIFADFSSTLLGVISIVKGRVSSGIKTIEETKQRLIENERHGWIAFWENLLGNVYLQMLQKGEKPSMSFLIHNLGFLIKNAPRADRTAEAHFNRAVDQAKKNGNKGILGSAYLNLGLLHKAKKREDQAKKYLAEAVKTFEETEAKVFLKQAREILES